MWRPGIRFGASALHGLRYFFFCFLPVYFLVHIALNAVGIANGTLFLLLTLPASAALFYVNRASLTDVVPSPLALLLLGVAVAFLSGVNFLVGADRATDAYFYHLNISVPLALYHRLLGSHVYDLVSFSQGFPKFGELAQATLIQLTGNFWGYGLVSVLVIPASYAAVASLGRAVGLGPRYADLAGLTYAFNPLHFTQATSSYVDTLQGLYLLFLLGMVFRPLDRPLVALFALNAAALMNVKFTGALAGAALTGLLVLLRFRDLAGDRRVAALGLGGGLLTGAAHYLVNVLEFRTPFHPFIDRRLAAAYYAYFYYAEPIGKLEQLRQLFWGWPARLADVAGVDATRGAFGLPWYPVPLFVAAALIIAWRSGNRPFLMLQGVCLGLLWLDPAPAAGRYAVWYQAAGFLAVMLVAQRAGAVRTSHLAPLVSAGLAAYVLFVPEQGLLAERRQLGRRFTVLERTSTPGHALPHYYDIYSNCSGYYWYLRYRNVVPRIVAAPPAEAGSHVYITADHLRHCWTALSHQADVELTVTRGDATDRPRLDVRVKDPFAVRDCTICASDYGCMYLPMLEWSLPLRFPSAGRKTVRVRCTTLDGQRIERHVEVDAP